MEGSPSSNLLVEGTQIATSYLEAGEQMAPTMLADRWGDRRAEQFDRKDLGAAQQKLSEFLHGAAGDEACALVYIGRVRSDEDAIIIEYGQAGRSEAEVFVQRFRPRRGRLRRFKLIGQPTPVGTKDVPHPSSGM
jgi:hypothetical protein